MNGTLTMILPLIILLAVMYFLLIRPQKKREKEVNAMRSGVQVGDEIITIGGICGKIVKTKDESLIIQVGADKVKFEVMRWSVSKVVKEARAKVQDYDDDEDEVEEKKPAKPKRMKKAAPAKKKEEVPEEDEELEEVEEIAEEEEPAEAEEVVEEAEEIEEVEDEAEEDEEEDK